MISTLLGTKTGMGAIYVDGKRVPVTTVTAGPCVVTMILAKSVQIGFGSRKVKNTPKSMQGHLKGSVKYGTPRFLCEIKVDAPQEYKIGDEIKADFFNVGDIVSVQSVSKGKGFAGGMKRWHFSGGSKTHGQSDRARAPGSIGQGTTPGRVFKGKHMAGRMGHDTVTVKNLKIMEVKAETNEVKISGSVAGPRGSLVYITKI
jgi:large subunit ribosomal protein L3